MEKKNKKVVVLPCSGIGKVFGALARETTYELVERVRPDVAVTTCLARVVIGDSETKELVKENPVITIDGCQKSCALKSAESQGVKVFRKFQTIDFFKAHKDMKPEGISEVDETGRKLAALAADELANVIDELITQEDQ
jgi:uncharacterized metal-binding protein